jgi:hypothetical protein
VQVVDDEVAPGVGVEAERHIAAKRAVALVADHARVAARQVALKLLGQFLHHAVRAPLNPRVALADRFFVRDAEIAQRAAVA